jgi:hypothetical protein
MTDIDTNVARRSPPPPTGVRATLGATATRTTPRLRLGCQLSPNTLTNRTHT